MKRAFRADYKVAALNTTVLERTSIPAATSSPSEFAILVLEVPGPILPGEVWEIAGNLVPENNLASDKNVFFRTEIWIEPSDGDSQGEGVRPDMTVQSGSFNLTPLEATAQYFREGAYQFENGVPSKRFVKMFGAAAGSNIDSGDDIGIRNGLLAVKRIIPFGVVG